MLADETADFSNKEQLILCLRWVDEDINVHEEFIGLHPMPGTTADENSICGKGYVIKNEFIIGKCTRTVLRRRISHVWCKESVQCLNDVFIRHMKYTN